MKHKIVVVGSSNTDMVIHTPRFPLAGETIIGGNFLMNGGGKGANQAVAAARLNGEVVFICKVGNDVFGKNALAAFEKEGIDISFSQIDEKLPSGIALITVDAYAENTIVVASGANANLLPEDIKMAEGNIKEAKLVLMQLESPMDTITYTVALASEAGTKVVLNPAPAQILPDHLLEKIDLITPNETEAQMLTGIEIKDLQSAKDAALQLHKKGVANVVITMGPKGALVYEADVFTYIEAIPVLAVDTTAAGDVFNGALVVAMSEGRTLVEAVRFACKAAAISVTRNGAQASAPYRMEVED